MAQIDHGTVMELGCRRGAMLVEASEGGADFPTGRFELSANSHRWHSDRRQQQPTHNLLWPHRLL